MKSLALLLALLTLPLLGGKKKETTEVLELPKDPPLAVAAETRNLIFQTTPLSNKGLLSQQTRDAVKALLKLNAGATIVKIRAFVVGPGDMRRVPAIVSEVLTEKKMPLPAVSVVQGGALPLEGAQVVLESIASSRRDLNPYGLAFISGQPSPTADQSLANLPADLLSVTCFTTSLDSTAQLPSILAARFPHAAVNVVMLQRAAPRTLVDCQATARAASPSAAKLAFTGTQMAFGFDEKDARLAFQRLDKALEPLGASLKSAAQINFYPLSNSIAAQVRRVGAEFLSAKPLPAVTIEPFEGLPAMEASFAMDAAAIVATNK